MSTLARRPILLASCVSGVAGSLSRPGVLGVSAPELKSTALAGVRGSQGLCTCDGIDGSGRTLLWSKNGRLGVAKVLRDGESRTECGPGWV